MFYNVIFCFSIKSHQPQKYIFNVFYRVPGKDLKNELRHNLKRQMAQRVSLWQHTLRQLFKSTLRLLFPLFPAFSFFLNE